MYSEATLKGSLDANTLADTDTTLILLEQTIFADLLPKIPGATGDIILNIYDH